MLVMRWLTFLGVVFTFSFYVGCLKGDEELGESVGGYIVGYINTVFTYYKVLIQCVYVSKTLISNLLYKILFCCYCVKSEREQISHMFHSYLLVIKVTLFKC